MGSINPIADIAAAAREAHARRAGPSGRSGSPPPLLVHTDAAQSAGKVALDARALGVDAMTVVGAVGGGGVPGKSARWQWDGGGEEGGQVSRRTAAGGMGSLGLWVAAVQERGGGRGPRASAHVRVVKHSVCGWPALEC